MISTTSPTTTRAALALSLLLLGAAPASPEEAAAARATIEQVMITVLATLRDDQLGAAEKKQQIEAIAVARFDFERITKLVLARNARRLNDEQRAQFLEEFRRHLSITYVRRLSRFTDEEVQLGATQVHKNGDVTVKTLVVGGPATGVTLDYRMRRRDGDWYAIDLVIEGISMIQNFRAQVQEIVSSRGPDGLIDALRQKNEASSKPTPDRQSAPAATPGTASSS